jgi:putative transposase
LFVIIDIFSRYVVGWMVAHRESATLAEQFIHATCARHDIGRDQLTIHADRGQAMTSKSVAFLLADLGVTKTHSRPHVSNDNPFSEAQFKTLKYRPAFPDRFGSIQDARAHGPVFFPWYNTEHHHSSLGLLTPHDVHFGLAARGGSHQKSLASRDGMTVQCGPWRWANARASRRRCGYRPPSCRSRRAIRSTPS